MADITLGIGAEASQARAVIGQLAASIDALSATLAKAVPFTPLTLPNNRHGVVYVVARTVTKHKK